MIPLEKAAIEAKDKKPPFAYYYLRITQEDGHMAWSSPIWVDYIPLSRFQKCKAKNLLSLNMPLNKSFSLRILKRKKKMTMKILMMRNNGEDAKITLCQKNFRKPFLFLKGKKIDLYSVDHWEFVIHPERS